MGGTDEGFPPRIDEISPGIVLQCLFTKSFKEAAWLSGHLVRLRIWQSRVQASL